MTRRDKDKALDQLLKGDGMVSAGDACKRAPAWGYHQEHSLAMRQPLENKTLGEARGDSSPVPAGAPDDNPLVGPKSFSSCMMPYSLVRLSPGLMALNPPQVLAQSQLLLWCG